MYAVIVAWLASSLHALRLYLQDTRHRTNLDFPTSITITSSPFSQPDIPSLLPLGHWLHFIPVMPGLQEHRPVICSQSSRTEPTASQWQALEGKNRLRCYIAIAPFQEFWLSRVPGWGSFQKMLGLYGLKQGLHNWAQGPGEQRWVHKPRILWLWRSGRWYRAWPQSSTTREDGKPRRDGVMSR